MSRRVINIDKEVFDIIKGYCERTGYSLTQWAGKKLTEAMALDKIAKKQLFIISNANADNYISLAGLFYKVIDVEGIVKDATSDILTSGNSYFKVNVASKHGITSIYHMADAVVREENKKNEVTFTCEKEILQNYEMLHFRNIASMDVLPYGIPFKWGGNKVKLDHSIIRLKRIIESELTKLGIIHLYALGYRDELLVRFDLIINEEKLREIVETYYELQ